MWNEIAGCQIALLLDVQQAWLQEMMKLRSRWKLGRIVTRSLNILLGPVARKETFTCEHCGREVPAVAPGTRRAATARTACGACTWRPAQTTAPPTCKGQMEPVAVSTAARRRLVAGAPLPPLRDDARALHRGGRQRRGAADDRHAADGAGRLRRSHRRHDPTTRQAL